MIDEPGLRLFSDDLLSKWGFNDGDRPDWLWEYAKNAPEDVQRAIHDADWHDVLDTLVRERLLPVLAQNHEIEYFYTITNHNPARATTVDDVPIDHRGSNAVELTPEWVDVPLDVVLEACRRNAPRR